MKIYEIFLMLSNSYEPAYLDWYMHQTAEKHPEIEGYLQPVLDLYSRDYCVGALDMFFAMNHANKRKETWPADNILENVSVQYDKEDCDCEYCQSVDENYNTFF